MKGAVNARRSLVLRVLLGSASPFIVLCGIIAIFYLVYRVGLVAFPAVVVGESFIKPARAQAAVCSEEDDLRPRDPAPIMSSAYQQRVKERSMSSANLVVNGALVRDQDRQPKDYGRSTEKADDYESPEENGYVFLRVKSSGSEGNSSPAWLMPQVNLSPRQTYAYSFSYRGDVPVRVAVEMKVKGRQQLEYRTITSLEATKDWRSFTAHINSEESIEAIRVIATPSGRGILDVKSFDVRLMPSGELKRGVVSVTFDDGLASVGTDAVAILNKYQIRSTQYVMSEIAGQNAASYMSVETLKELKSAGHEIGSHSLTHCNQASLEGQILQDNALKSKEALEQQGLGPIRSFTYPFGRYDGTTQGIFSKNYQYIRTSDAGYNDRYFDETNIRAMSVLDSTSEKTFAAWLDHARTNHLWMVLVYHRVNESGTYNVTSEQLDRQLAAVAGSGLRILPLSEAAEAVRSEAPRPAATAQSTPSELPQTGTKSVGDAIVLGLLTLAACSWVASRRMLGRTVVK